MNNSAHKIRPNAYHIYDGTEAYYSLVIGTERALLIDTGSGCDDVLSAVKALTDLPLLVINTHGHYDHTGGNDFFDEVMIHKADLTLLRRHSSLPYRFIIDRSRKKKRIKGGRRPGIKLIEDGGLIDLGGGCVLEVIHTPGHTAGSVCLLDRKNRLLFSGDSFSSHVWLCLKESVPVGKYIQSVEKMIARSGDFDRIISSHSLTEFKTTLLPKIESCARNIDPAQSADFPTPVGKALLYMEGFEKITEKYGFRDFQEFITNVDRVPVEEISAIEFASIAYVKS